MKKKSSADKVCEPCAEYDLGALLPYGVQGKYVERCRQGTNLVLLEPDVAAAFPNQDAVNRALRLVMELSGIATVARRTAPAPKTSRKGSSESVA